MNRDKKKKLMSKFAKHDGDTGSSEVQAAILSERINELSEHLKKHPKDDHSRRGLFKLVSKRRKQLNYLKLADKEKYEKMLKDLKLRK